MEEKNYGTVARWRKRSRFVCRAVIEGAVQPDTKRDLLLPDGSENNPEVLRQH